MALFKRKDSDKWWADFTVGGHRYRVSTERTNKAEAGMVEAALRKAKLDALQLGAKEVWTLGDLADRWMAVEGGRLKDADGNRSRLRKLFGEELKPWGLEAGVRHGLSRGLKVHELTNGLLLELVEARKREGNSGATINRELALLQTLLRFAGAPGRNVAVPQGLHFAPLRQREAKRTRWLTPDEEARLLAELDPQRPGTYSAVQRRLMQDQYDRVLLLLDTGARYEEASSLPWDCVDLDRGRLLIHRGKVGNDGALVMTQRLRMVLMRRRDTRNPKTPYVFPSLKDPRKPIGHCWQGVAEAMARAGINDPHMVARHGKATPNHTLRHTFAARLAQRGMSLHKVAVLLGHSSTATTERYAHLAAGDVAHEAAALLEGA